MAINPISNYLWLAFAVLMAGSVYLIIEGIKVHALFSESVVGKLVKTLVVVFLIELYSLAVVSFAYVILYPNGITVILPVVFLWLLSLIYAILAVRSAKKEVTKLIK